MQASRMEPTWSLLRLSFSWFSHFEDPRVGLNVPDQLIEPF